jgi:hypothetical protein
VLRGAAIFRVLDVGRGNVDPRVFGREDWGATRASLEGKCLSCATRVESGGDTTRVRAGEMRKACRTEFGHVGLLSARKEG